MGHSIKSDYCMARDWLSPDSTLFMSKFFCDLFDIGFYPFFLASFFLWMCPGLLFFVTFCLWMPPIVQGITLLGIVAPLFLVFGDHRLPSRLPKLDLWPGSSWLSSLLVPSLTYLVPPMWEWVPAFVLLSLEPVPAWG